MMDEREPEYWLHFKGDKRQSFPQDRPLGPSTMRELLWPIDAEYDTETDMTTVGLSKQTPMHLLNMQQGSRGQNDG